VEYALRAGGRALNAAASEAKKAVPTVAGGIDEAKGTALAAAGGMVLYGAEDLVINW
jgi:hypothetical protein